MNIEPNIINSNIANSGILKHLSFKSLQQLT